MPIPKDKILIIIPALNEATRISPVITRLLESGYPKVLVVDDGSTDNTVEVAEMAGATVISHVINRGPGAATQTGFMYARRNNFSALITIDADGQHDVEDVENLVEALEDNDVDIVFGSRFLSQNDIPKSRIVFNKIANIFTFLFCGKWVTDSQSGIKALNKKAFYRLDIHTDGYEFCSEMVIRAHNLDLKSTEIPVKVYYTAQSQAKGQNFFVGVVTAVNLLHNFIFRDNR